MASPLDQTANIIPTYGTTSLDGGKSQYTYNQQGFTSQDPGDQHSYGTLKEGAISLAATPVGGGIEYTPYMLKNGQLFQLDPKTIPQLQAYNEAMKLNQNISSSQGADSKAISDYVSAHQQEFAQWQQQHRWDATVASPARFASEQIGQQVEQAKQQMTSQLKAEIVGSNVPQNYKSYAEKAGILQPDKKAVSMTEAQTLAAKPASQPQLDPNNQFVKRSQGQLPPSDFSGGKYIGKDPNAPENMNAQQQQTAGFGTPTGTQSQGQAGALQNIPFKQGLSPEQQQSIQTLASKPANQWTPTDQANWAYATNNAPAPTSPITSGGVTGGASGAGGTTSSTGAVPMSLDQMKTNLQGIGIDISGLSDQQIQTLGAMNQVMVANADKNKNIGPASLSPQDVQSFLDQAKANIDPYYQELLKQGTQDINQASAQLSGNWNQTQTEQAKQFAEQQKAASEQFAAAGLAKSGIRQQAEARLKEQQSGVVKSQRSQLQNQLYSLGSQFERTYGSQALAGVNPNITGPNAAGTQYQALGGMMGTNVKDETTNVQTAATGMQQTEIAKRNMLSGFTPATA